MQVLGYVHPTDEKPKPHSACVRTLKWKEEWIAGILIPEWGCVVCVLYTPEYFRCVLVHMQVGAKGGCGCLLLSLSAHCLDGDSVFHWT